MLIPARARPQAIVQMRQRRHAEAAMRRQLGQQQRQRDRVGASRKADQQTGAERAESVPPDRPPNLLLDLVQIPNPKAQIPKTETERSKAAKGDQAWRNDGALTAT